MYNAYSYDLLQAIGEFPYNAFDNSDTQVKEYISPPEIWIREKNGKKGINWFLGEHIAAKEIKQAFALDSVPYRNGIGAVQPAGYINTGKLALVTLLGFAGLLLMHLIFTFNNQNRVITQGTYYFTDSTDKITSITPKFTLDKWRSNLEFNITAPVSNSWFEMDAVLVNTATGKEYTVEQGIEYYYGYSEGESWSEGETYETAYINNLPAGTYFLQLDGSREKNAIKKLDNYSIKVIYDAVSYRNFWFALLLFLVFPVATFFWSRYAEKSRWEDSPFSIYNDN